jgi:hypothetical protein
MIDDNDRYQYLSKIRRQDASCPAAFAYGLSFGQFNQIQCEATFFSLSKGSLPSGVEVSSGHFDEIQRAASLSQKCPPDTSTWTGFF